MGAVAFCEKDLHCWQWLHGNFKKKKKNAGGERVKITFFNAYYT